MPQSPPFFSCPLRLAGLAAQGWAGQGGHITNVIFWPQWVISVAFLSPIQPFPQTLKCKEAFFLKS